MFILTIVLDQQDGYCEIGLLKKVKSVFLKHTLLDTMLLLVQLAATHIEKSFRVQPSTGTVESVDFDNCFRLAGW